MVDLARSMGDCVGEIVQQIDPQFGGLFCRLVFGVGSRIRDTVFGVFGFAGLHDIDPVGSVVNGFDERVCGLCLLCVLGYGLSSPFVFYNSLSFPCDASWVGRMDWYCGILGMVFG